MFYPYITNRQGFHLEYFALSSDLVIDDNDQAVNGLPNTVTENYIEIVLRKEDCFGNHHADQIGVGEFFLFGKFGGVVYQHADGGGTVVKWAGTQPR